MFPASLTVMLTAAIGLLLTILSVSSLVLYVMSRRRMMSLTKTIPGPAGLPLLGNSLMLRGSPTFIFNNQHRRAVLYKPTSRGPNIRWRGIAANGITANESCNLFLQKETKRHIELYEKYGGIYKIFLGPKLYVMISNPADAQSVLKNSKLLNRDPNVTKALSQYFGNGLLTSRDDIWRRNHKLISAAFRYKNLVPYLKIFQNKANIFVDKLGHIADGRTTDIHYDIEMCMLDAICETAIGVNMKIQESGEHRAIAEVSKAQEMMMHRVLNPWLMVDWIYAMSSHYKTSESLVKLLHAFSEEVIATKLNKYREGSSKSNDPTSSGKKIQSFLDILIEASERGEQILSPNEIRDEVSTIAAAGSETVTSVLSYAFVLLGLHPCYQEKINEELLEVFGDSDREPTLEDIHNLKHVDYCIKETLRLFPIAAFLPREINEDVEITEGRILPAGSIAVVCLFPMHRSADYFTDPDSFCPDRWSPENSIGRQTDAYLPFAAGNRMCVGYKYASLVIPTVLIAILRRYRISCRSHTLDELSKNIAMGIASYSSIGYKVELYRK